MTPVGLRRVSVKFTKPDPPTPAPRRRSRKPRVYALLARWSHGELGWLERETLRGTGRYDRWLSRGRITAEMAAELLLYHLGVLERLADDPVADAATERERVIQILRRRLSAFRADDPAHSAGRAALRDLEALQQRALERRPAIFEGMVEGEDERYAAYRPEDGTTAVEHEELYAKHRVVIEPIQGTIMEQLERANTMRIGGPGNQGTSITLGGRRSRREDAEAFRRELGSTFVDPTTSMGSRAAQVRKWRHLMRRGNGS